MWLPTVLLVGMLTQAAAAQEVAVPQGEGQVTVLLTTRGYLAPLARHHVLVFPVVRAGGSLSEAACDVHVEVDARILRVDDPRDRLKHGLPGTIGVRQRRRIERRIHGTVLRTSEHHAIRFTATRCHQTSSTFDGALEVGGQQAPISGRARLQKEPQPRLLATSLVQLDHYDLPRGSRWLGLIMPEPTLPVVIDLPLN